VTGLLFRYTDTWQLVINTNTGTTIVTFLMVFLIQRTQDKNALAIQLKLNEIVAAIDGASNRLINVEDLTESGAANPLGALPSARRDGEKRAPDRRVAFRRGSARPTRAQARRARRAAVRA